MLMNAKVIRNSVRIPIRLIRTLQDDAVTSARAEGLKAFRDLAHRVNNERDCWAWQIQAAAMQMRQAQDDQSVSTTTNTEAVHLMKACASDIVDLFPSDQKLLTEIAWECVKGTNIRGNYTVVDSYSFCLIFILVEGISPEVYNKMILAYKFQEMSLNVPEVLSELESKQIKPDFLTHLNLVDYLCRRGLIKPAIEYMEKNEMRMSEELGKFLIFGYCANGQVTEGENVLKLLNEKNIFWNANLYKSFALGSSKFGDENATEFFLNKSKNASDALLLQAIQMMNSNHPEKVSFLIDKLPVNAKVFSAKCRRTVKILLESGNIEAAWRLVMKCQDGGENNSEKVRVIKISPSVIALKHFISNCDQSERILEKIEQLLEVDSRIKSRAVVTLVELLFEDSRKLELAKKVIQEILTNSTDKELETIKNYIGQSSKRKLADASKISEAEVLKVFNTYCALGLSIDKIRAWDVMMKILIPSIPNHGTWSQSELEEACFVAKKSITTNCHGLYSQSVIWSHILQHLINREDQLFFKTAAKICKNLKVAYGPNRWYLSLANCLVKTNDVKSFMDILEICYINCDKKKDWNDYHLVCSSIYVAIVRAQNRHLEVDDLLGNVVDELWKRNLRIPVHIREEILGKLRDFSLRNMFENVPVLGGKVFKKTSLRGIV